MKRKYIKASKQYCEAWIPGYYGMSVEDRANAIRYVANDIRFANKLSKKLKRKEKFSKLFKRKRKER